MRLIDADKLHPDRMTNRGTVAISQSQIAHAPTVDVLDKIRDEIKQMDTLITRSEVLEVIDKYLV